MKEEKKDSFIKKIFKRYKKIIIGVILVALVAVGTVISIGPQFFTDSKTTKLGFEDIGELSTQVAYCTNVSTIDVSRVIWGQTIPFTQSKSVFSYDSIIKAGIDFSEVTWKVNEETKKITVKLPPCKVFSNEMDPDTFKVYHEEESVFRNISLTENNESLKKLKATAEKDAIKNGLLKEARKNAEVILKGFIGQEYDMETYDLKFTDK